MSSASEITVRFASLSWQFCGPSQALQVRLWPTGNSSRRPAIKDKQQKTVLIMMSNTGGWMLWDQLQQSAGCCGVL
jgi:hypothetical protein